MYAVAGRDDLVLKVYHQPIDGEKVAKLQAMIERTPPGVGEFAAWPLKVLKNKDDRPMAVVMPRISNARDIHQLYSPRGRRTHFPRADWAFLLLAAQNLARAFANVHELGCVVGDVNHASVLVKDDAKVALIDCDSFQVRVADRLFPCEVAVPTFTPPELQGRSLRGVERTGEHDAFGLAVLIFHLLFMGRHPFAGRPMTNRDVSIEKAIEEYRFAFSKDRARVMLEPPPNTLPLSDASPLLGDFFERAFGPQGRRPSPSDWNAVLGEVRSKTRRCSSESSHVYFNALGACPWCKIEASSGAILFQSSSKTVATNAVRENDLDQAIIETLWRAITSVRRPTVSAVPSRDALAPVPAPSDAATKVGSVVENASMAGIVCGGIAGFATANAMPDVPIMWAFAALALYWVPRHIAAQLYSKQRESLFTAHAGAKQRWDAVVSRWRAELSPDAFDALMRQLGEFKKEHDQLATPLRVEQDRRASRHKKAVQVWTDRIVRRAAEIRASSTRRGQSTFNLSDAELVAGYDALLTRHLESHSIEGADISGIGASRKATLASFGIETAADISQSSIVAVPGFGPHLAGRLIGWQKQISTRFLFSPIQARSELDAGRLQPERPPVAPQAVIPDERTRRRLRQIEADLSTGARRLQDIATRIQKTAETLLVEAKRAALEYSKAEADARAAKIIR